MAVERWRRICEENKSVRKRRLLGEQEDRGDTKIYEDMGREHMRRYEEEI